MGTNPKCRVPQPNDFVMGRNGGCSVRLHWSPAMGPRFSGAMQQAQTMFDHECARLTDKYVPKDSGTLKNSVITASDFGSGMLVYNTPYARAQYYRHELGTGLHSGLRGAHWGERMVNDNKAHLHSFVAGAIKKGIG